MNIKTKAIISVLIVLIALGIFINERRNIINSLPSNLSVAMESPSLTGWSEGKKVWEMKAASIVDADNTKVVHNVYDGYFLYQDKKQAIFNAKEVIYETATGKLKFIQGLKLKTKGDTEIAADGAQWEMDGQRLVTEGDVYLKNKNFTIIGQAIAASNNFNSIAVTGNVNINLDKDIQLMADGACFEEEQKLLKLAGHAIFVTYSQNMQKTKFMTAELEAYPEIGRLTSTGIAEVDMPGFAVKAYQLVYDKETKILELNGATGTTTKGDGFSAINTTVAVSTGIIKAQKALLDFKPVIIQDDKDSPVTEHVVLNADILQSDGGTSLSAENIMLTRNNSNRFTARHADIASFARSLNLSGGVTLNIDEDISLITEQIKYQWEKALIESEGKAVMQHASSGTLVTTAKASVSWHENKMIFTGDVTIAGKNGSLMTAQKATYLLNTKQLILSGNIVVMNGELRAKTIDKLVVTLTSGEVEANTAEKLIFQGKLW